MSRILRPDQGMGCIFPSLYYHVHAEIAGRRELAAAMDNLPRNASSRHEMSPFKFASDVFRDDCRMGVVYHHSDRGDDMVFEDTVTKEEEKDQINK